MSSNLQYFWPKINYWIFHFTKHYGKTNSKLNFNLESIDKLLNRQYACNPLNFPKGTRANHAHWGGYEVHTPS